MLTIGNHKSLFIELNQESEVITPV